MEENRTHRIADSAGQFELFVGQRQRLLQQIVGRAIARLQDLRPVARPALDLSA